MIRQMIHIDEEKCIGCGLCAKACKESAIEMVNGKAKLIRDDYCDGLGNCLPACPVDAISFIQREAAAFDEEAVKANQAKKGAAQQPVGSCPGTRMRLMCKEDAVPMAEGSVTSQLRQWPVQIKLVSQAAAYFDHARLLVAADCTAYAYGNFHQEFIRNRVTLIGCTKLDDVDYSEKLAQIFALHDIRDVTVVRMAVPCCGGMERAVLRAVENCGRQIPVQVVVIGTDGSKN